MKAGTTSLYQYLKHHPQVFMPDTKEVNFFNPRRNWRRGVQWYERQFEMASDDVVAIGEASTSYTKYPWVAEASARIASVLDDVQLIYVVRHPIERMQSQYIHNMATGQEWRPIDQAFRKESMYLNISRYALQIEQYLPYFPRERFLIIDSRDLRNDRAASMRRVFRFLGVDQDWVPPAIDREYFRSADRRMKPALSRKIRRIPRVRTLAGYVPAPVKRLKHTLTQRLPTEDLDRVRARLTDDLRERLRAALREDVARLRPHMGSGFDGWGIG
jgi:hypothetical protein